MKARTRPTGWPGSRGEAAVICGGHRRRRASYVAHLILPLTLLACSSGQRSGSEFPQPVQSHDAIVPSATPDFFPIALFNSLGVVTEPNYPHATPLVRSIVAVFFKAGATRDARKAAIDSISGQVVGGLPWIAGDGDYYVRIPGKTFESIVRALATLRALPQVDMATPMFNDPLSYAAHGGSVPAVAPDFFPRDLYDSLGFVSNPNNPHAFPWVRSIVTIVFKAGTRQEAREAAVNAIHGQLVGGFRWIAGDGDYDVRIPGTTYDAILKALDTLKKLPQVDMATPMIKDTISQSLGRRPPPSRRSAKDPTHPEKRMPRREAEAFVCYARTPRVMPATRALASCGDGGEQNQRDSRDPST